MDGKKMKKIFSNNLAKLLYETDITQKELAVLSGVSEASISKYIHGLIMPKLDAMVNMAEVLGCELSDFIPVDKCFDI